jgi:hypothetical protein
MLTIKEIIDAWQKVYGETYYDLSQQGYRCATGQIWITAGVQ